LISHKNYLKTNKYNNIMDNDELDKLIIDAIKNNKLSKNKEFVEPKKSSIKYIENN